VISYGLLVTELAIQLHLCVKIQFPYSFCFASHRASSGWLFTWLQQLKQVN